MAGLRVTPTLFDKLTSGFQFDTEPSDAAGAPAPAHIERSALSYYIVAQYERFNEQALKNTVKRELNWLFNTVQLGATTDLDPYPQVRRSVLNYGVPDMAGKTGGRRMLQARAREIRDAIRTFEPRLNPDMLDVEVLDDPEREQAITMVVRSDVVSAVNALPVQFKTDVDVDTGAATVRD